VGVIQGNSEHGSRALGNRSIICNPVGDMKDVLNNKVKHREWYRPFAPMVRLEDCPKYFEFDEGVESRHMVFVANVREEWREKLPAITHQDNTARLQTVTRNQNPLIYDLLGELEKHTGHGVLLNTSFNVDGKPILTRLSDAFKILRETQLDAVYYEGKLIVRTNNDNFNKQKHTTKPKEMTNETSIYICSFKEDDVAITNDIEKIKGLVRDGRNITVIIPKHNHEKYVTVLPETSSLKYFLVTNKQHYYDSRLKPKFNIPHTTTIALSKYIKLLWCRDAVELNPYNSKYHLFVNLDELDERSYAYNISRDVDLLSQFAKTDDYVVMTSKKDLETVITKEYMLEKFKKAIDHHPTTALFCGNAQNLAWMFSNYEGQLLWYMDSGKVGKDYDYLTISALENEYRFKFLDA
jgi:predicted transport protein